MTVCASKAWAETKRNSGQLKKMVSSFFYNDTSNTCDVGIIAPISDFNTLPLFSGSNGGLYVRNKCLPQSK